MVSRLQHWLAFLGLPASGRCVSACNMAAWVCMAMWFARPSGLAEDRPRFDFSSDIYGVLQRSCFECHGSTKQEGGLRLDLRQEVLDSGILHPEQPQKSELLRRIELPRTHAQIMPAIGDPLSAAEIATLRQWIEGGAHWPEQFQPPRHWAYESPQRPQLPQRFASDWIQSPIDFFVLQQLEQQRLAPSPPATPRKLVRRVFLDVIGLPPTPQEIDHFLQNDSERRFEELVDELLNRPQFGERWARPWLDLARYADSHGFQRDDLRDIWAYRDWVIQALNDDMPFDQFTIEQLAGDLLPGATESQRIATGFQRCAPTNVEAGSLPEETRIEQVIDRVNTTAAVWLGTTLECCQCHDHKYDPFSQQDYYRLLAFYNSTEQEADRADADVPSSIRFNGPTMQLANPERNARRKKVQAQFDELERQLAETRRQMDASLEAWLPELQLTGSPQHGALPTAIAQLVDAPLTEWTDKQRKQLIDYRLTTDERSQRLSKRVAGLGKKLESLAADTTLVMVELAEPRATTTFIRGDYRTPGQAVEAGTPDALHPLQAGGATRLDLARWLVSADNPLVARVTVNRLWAELFGQGLVDTPEDFGVKGSRPTHPQLLDWLAVEFMQHGWSTKRLLKAILMSSTYQQSSSITADHQERDPGNRLLARGPRFRLSAEAIRDNALAIAGLLDLEKFGPPIRPEQPQGLWSKVGGIAYKYEVTPGSAQYRRGIYVIIKRGSPYPSFMNFDASARLACTLQRSRTNTPLQALTLLNDPVYVAAAKALAERMASHGSSDAWDDNLDYGFQLCTARLPTEQERQILRQLFSLQAQISDAGSDGPQTHSLAWTSVASVLLNLHETVTKD